MINLKDIKKQLKGKPVAVAGLGASGLAVFNACMRAGIDCVVWDDDATARADAEAQGAKVIDLAHADLSRYAFVCLSPGIPLTYPEPHPIVDKAHQDDCPIIGDIELFHMAKPEAKTIGITATNGKSTTTALIHHILKTTDIPCALGGNFGVPALEMPDLAEDGVYVLELSSFQLDLCTTFAPDTAVVLNITPDHFDRHGDMAGYVAAKKRIMRGPGAAIIGIDSEETEKLHEIAVKEGMRQCISISCENKEALIFVKDNGLLYDGTREICDLKECPNLQGRHNWQNAASAYAVGRVVGMAVADIVKGLQSFPGLEHRQKTIRTINGIRYINDSKSTNDESAAVALAAFNPIYWIAGGKSKGGGYIACEKYLDHVRHVFLIGEATEAMASWLEKQNIPYTKSGAMGAAVAAAHKLAQQEALDQAAVLLAPACASFDQFKNFEQRGDTFIALINALNEKSCAA